jgi:hypothetical protein
MTSKFGLLSIALVACLAAAGPIFAQETKIEGEEKPAPIPSSQSMSDWPCVQGRVDQISVAQIWDGPPIGEDKSWVRDKEINDLAKTLASRRVKVEAAEAALKKFADSQPADTRDARLTQVFAALFDTMSSQRRSILSGIGKYQKAQRDRAAELEKEGTEIAKLEQKAASDASAAKELDEANEKFQWTSRIFQDRQMNIPLACELPVLLEERLYEISRTIRGLMKS